MLQDRINNIYGDSIEKLRPDHMAGRFIKYFIASEYGKELLRLH